MEVNQRTSRGVLTVYWDGQCPFCGAVRARINHFDSTRRLKFVDINDPEVARTASPRFTQADLDHEMHVLMPDGTWRTGFFAVAALLSVLPVWTWLGTLMHSWFLADIGPKVYLWVAGHRYLISRVLGLPAPCDVSGSCRIG